MNRQHNGLIITVVQNLVQACARPSCVIIPILATDNRIRARTHKKQLSPYDKI